MGTYFTAFLMFSPFQHLTNQRRGITSCFNVCQYQSCQRGELNRAGTVVPGTGVQNTLQCACRKLRESADAISGNAQNTTYFAFHQRVQNARAESPVNLAPKHRGRYVKSAAHFTLGKAVHKLSGIVGEASAIPFQHGKICLAYGSKMEKQRGDQRRDQRCGGTHAGFVHISQFHAVVAKRGDLRERFYRSR